MIGKCSYGYYDADSETELECSGKGICNHETGLCECFSDYTGSVCNVVECKNRCSGHGMCVLSHNTDYDVNSFYPQLKNFVDKDYRTHGVGVCVCDREYYGDDCSLRKCQLGYNKSGENKIEINITTSGSTYIEYTDPFDRKWYSSKIILENGKIKQYGYYEFTDNKYPSDLSSDNNNTLLGWCYILSDFFYTLPPGTIDLKNTSLGYDNRKLLSGCNSEKDGIKVTTATTTTNITLTFGPNQSGRQGKVRFLTLKDYDNIESGEVDTSIFTSASLAAFPDAVSYKYRGIYPKICGENGSCNTYNGVCDCFDDSTGYTCEIPYRND